jgi:hypothetical protein
MAINYYMTNLIQKCDFDWKKFQFITMVQTALIHNTINMSLEDDIKSSQKRHNVSVTVSLIRMDDAFYAAERIPEDKTATEAACEFVDFICENLWKDGKKPDVPIWFAR